MLYKMRLFRALAYQLRNFKILSFGYGQLASIWKQKSEFSDGEENVDSPLDDKFQALSRWVDKQ